jgi:hypothetical protein
LVAVRPRRALQKITFTTSEIFIIILKAVKAAYSQFSKRGVVKQEFLSDSGKHDFGDKRRRSAI